MGQSNAATPSPDSKPVLPLVESSGSAEQKRPVAPKMLGPRPSSQPSLDRSSPPGNAAGSQPYYSTDAPQMSMRSRAGVNPSCCNRPVERVYCMPAHWCQAAPYGPLTEVINEPDLARRQAYPQAGKQAALLQTVSGMMTPAGGVYAGQIGLDGRPQGEGEQKYPNGTRFKGQWAEGAAHGEGDLLLPSGKGYSGSWKVGLKHGAGKEESENGVSYVGEYEEGHREGQGDLGMTNGSNYSGKFHKGEFHGEGELVWPDKRVYTGQWQGGLMHGFGTFNWPDGKSHSGHYEEDRRHGPGLFTWPDGSVCKGRWQDGKLHGSGTYIDAEGVSRHGRWECGERLYWTK